MTTLGWAGDFTYDYYRKILKVVGTLFIPRLFREAANLPGLSGSAFLRHDIDISLWPALRMAAIEQEQHLSSTYMVMVRSRLYDVSSTESARILSEILGMGHEVGVHFDCPEELRHDHGDISTLESSILEDCRRLEDVLGTAVQSISFHRPVPWLLRGALMVNGKVNAYANELMHWYLSDSKGNWRAGEPLGLLKDDSHSVLQLLTHPIWWGKEHQSPAERLESFYLFQTRRMEPASTAQFDQALAATIPGIMRSGVVKTTELCQQ
jgi:hypothetical protein